MMHARYVGFKTAAIFLSATALSLAAPLGTGFTYQGELRLNGQRVDSSADLICTLWAAAVNGQQVGPVVELNNVTVDKGLFQIELDFGSNAFNSDKRWLQIWVRSPAGDGGYSALSPRQPLTAAPYASTTRGIHVAPDGDVVIGGEYDPVQSRFEVLGQNQPAARMYSIGDEVDVVVNALEVLAMTSGTPEPGFGSRLTFRAEAENGGLASVAQIDAVLTNPSTAGIRGDLIFRTIEPGSFTERPERMRITGDGRVFVGRDEFVSSAEYFGVHAPEQGNGFGGMYVSTESETAKPFYGYSVNGNVDAYHFYDGVSDTWSLYIDGAERLVVASNGNVGIGDDNPDATLDVHAANDVKGVTITQSTSNQIPALEIKTTGNSFPVLITAEGGISNLAKFRLNNSTSVAPAFEVEADTVGPVAYFESTNSVHNRAAIHAVNPGTGSSAYAVAAFQTATNTNTAAIHGNNTNTEGRGVGVSGIGGWRGVFGQGLGDGAGTRTGVYGGAVSSAATNYGIFGVALNGVTNWAGWFAGNVNVTGTLSKGGGSFKIDHPLDPENKYLYHSFVESPDMMNIYNGNVSLDSGGVANVELPDWFATLNRDYRYQLTAIRAPGPNLYIAEEVRDNRFVIAGGEPGMRVSWQVTGIRQDAFANANRIPVEQDKPAHEQGYYLHPSVHGKSRASSVEVANDPTMAEYLGVNVSKNKE